MQITENQDLKNFNTFGVSIKARFFTVIENEQDLKEILVSSEFKNNPKLFLGGGSNMLLTKDFDGIVIQNKIKGIEVKDFTDDSVLVKAMSGEWWNELVDFTVLQGWWGLENLALIPGTTGAAPMQNIGAYGVELKDTLVNVEAIDIETLEKRIFSNEECLFGYRDSIFKNELKGKYFILSTTLKLSKKEKRNIEYKVLKDYLEQNNIIPDSSKVISEAVSAIRRSKLPDPKVIGNAGSFFKNIFVSKEIFDKLIITYPNMPSYQEEGRIKIPTAWLIENSGPIDGVSWKGYRKGHVGVHNKQALVLVNHGDGKGQEVKELAEEIIASVWSKFGILLIPEVNLI